MPVTNLTLCNVNILAPTKTFDIYSGRAIKIIDSNLGGPNSTNTLTLYNADITVTNSAGNTNLVSLGGLVRPGTNNTLAFFSAKAAITDANMLGSGAITLGGSTLAFNQGAVSFSNSPIRVVADSTLAFTSGSNTLRGVLSDSGPLTLYLPGNSVLSLLVNSAGYGGNLTVSNGTLLVNNSAGSGTGTGLVTVASGAKLGGSGVIGASVTVNGTLAPGNSPGTLTISNDLVSAGGAVLQYELGTTSDLAVLTGNLTLGGTLNITDAGGFADGTYTLFTYGGALTYNGLGIGSAPEGPKHTTRTNL